jgi:hypothetical protein
MLDSFQKLDLIPSQNGTRWKKHAPTLSKHQLDQALYATEGAQARPVSGFDAFCEIGRVVPALWPLRLLARVPGVTALGRSLYSRIAENRHCLLDGSGHARAQRGG